MPDAYTYIAKPTGTPYTGVYFPGKQIYDDPNVIYDDSNVFYDSIDSSAYTNIPKPTGAYTVEAGMTQGLLIPLTRKVTNTLGEAYTYINKPTT